MKERLERLLDTEAVFENQIRDLRHTLYDRSFEPYPDFYLKTEDFKPAVELELNLKSRKRYLLKMSKYEDSDYSHVLYVAAHAKKIGKLKGFFNTGDIKGHSKICKGLGAFEFGYRRESRKHIV